MPATSQLAFLLRTRVLPFVKKTTRSLLSYLLSLISKLSSLNSQLSTLNSQLTSQLTSQQKITFSLVFLAATAGLILLLTTLARSRPTDNPRFHATPLSGWQYTSDTNTAGMSTRLRRDNSSATVEVRRGNARLRFTTPITNATLTAKNNSANYTTHSQLSTHNSQLSSPNSQLSSPNSQLSTRNSPLLTLNYQLSSHQLKESIILHQPQDQYDFLTQIVMENVTVKMSADDLPVFFDRNGEYQFHLEKPFAIDAAGARTDDVTYTLRPKTTTMGTNPFAKKTDTSGNLLTIGLREVEIATNELELVVTIDPNWLSSHARVYPVTIDPTVVHDTSSNFVTGTLNRVTDTGSGSNPRLETYWQELPLDVHTVGLWHMDESSGTTTVSDSSGNGNHGTSSSSTNVTGGRLGNARNFTGSPVNVGMAAGTNANVIGDITVEMWINPTNFSAQVTPIHKQAQYTFQIDTAGNVAWADSSNYSYANFGATNIGLAAGKWQHLAFTKTGGVVKIYLDGVEKASKTFGGAITGTSNILRFGCYANASACASQYFVGQLDEIRISDVARSPEEIRLAAARRPYSIYTSPVVDLTTVSNWNDLSWTELGVSTGDGETLFDNTSLVAQWNFNNTSGTTATNNAGSCGATCNGTLTNFASTASQDQAANTGWTANNRRWGAGALMFDGSDDNVSITHTAALNVGGGPFTIEAWVNPRVLTSRHGIFSTRVNNPAGAWMLEVGTGNGGTNRVSVTGLNTWIFDSVNNAIEPNKWSHIVYTRSSNSDTGSLYVNGKRVAAAATTSYTITDNTDAKKIGEGASNSQRFNGSIDSTRLYSRVLSADEILANYNATNIELQTRVGNSATADDGSWDAWEPVASEAQVESFDSGFEGKCTGGTVVGNTHTFTSSGSFSCEGDADVDVLVVAGGGGGGGGTYHSGGGGGGGAIYQTSFAVTAGSYSVTVGGGGAGGVNTNRGSNGGNSVFSSLTAIGGGGGSNYSSGAAFTGGSGGGGSYAYTTGANGTSGQGNNGGNASTAGSCYGAGGGGGAGAVGGNGSGGGGGVGGAGIANSISGSTQYYGGGGGGSVDGTGVTCNGLGGAGGIGGGGAGSPGNGTSGTANTGGGGGGAERDGTTGGSGGSGIVIIKVNSVAQNGFSDPNIKREGTNSQKLEFGKPQADGSTLGLWHLDETNGDNTGDDVFSSVGSVHLEMEGSSLPTAVVNGISGKARRFNGSADYLIRNSAVTTAITNWSMEAWINPANVSQLGMVAYNGNDAGGYGFGLSNGSGSAGGKLTVRFGAVAWFDCGYTFPAADQWYHVAVTRDTTTTRCYVNGVQTGSTSSSTPAAVSATFTIGAQLSEPQPPYNIESPQRYFNGMIDEVRFSNVTRNAEEIAEAYRLWRDYYLNKTLSSTDLSSKKALTFWVAADRPGTFLEATVGETAYANIQPDANTVGLWHLSELSGSGAYIKDSSGNGNHGTPTGTTFASGKVGKARNFNGSSDYIVPGTTNLPTGNSHYTIEAWIYPTATGNRGIVGWGNYGSTNQVTALRLNSTNQLTHYWWSNDITVTVGTITQEWHHVAASFDGTTRKVYYDGVLVGSDTPGGSHNASASNFRIGSTNNGEYFSGGIDEVHISNIARTAAEIRQTYEAGLRSHPVTIDFAAKLDAGNLIANSSDTSFTVDATYYGLGQKGSMLFAGDKVIVRETIDATEYIAQGTVTGVTPSTGAVTVAAWDSGGTFPSGGYTANASVFKWQREYFNVSNLTLGSFMDGITQLTLRVTDGNEGRTVWLDDLRSVGDYLTTPAGSTIASAIGKQYFQYRAILTSRDPFVSAALTAVELDYTDNTPPNTPSLDSPADTATDQLLIVALKTTATDDQSDYLRYKIELCTDVAMTTGCQTFDQTSSQTGWSGQNAQTSTAYTSGTQATYTLQADLSPSTTYYWRSYAIDPGGTDTWSATQSSPYSFTTSSQPQPPTILYTEGQSNPPSVIDLTPEFSARHNDTGGFDAEYYEVEVNTQADFSGTVMWDSGKTSMTATADGSRSPDISYAGTTLTLNGVTYYWRIRFWNENDIVSGWSEVQYFTMNNGLDAATRCVIRESINDAQLVLQWVDNALTEDGYEVQRAVNGGAFSLLQALAANAQTHTDATVSQGNTYAYRIAPYHTGPIYGNWCYAATLNLQDGNFMFEGLQLEGLLIN